MIHTTTMKIFNLKIALICGIAAMQSYGLNGTIHKESFTGPITGDEIFFNIYLPPGYENSTERYPLIYHLHGLNGNQGGNQNRTVPEVFEAAMEQNIIGPVIVVFPNGLLNSMWGNSKDGAKPVETHVIQELIPHVDNNYRTYKFRRARAIEGFSMGGYGALEYAAKFPEFFSSCVVYDGAIHTWSTLSTNQKEIATEIFENDGVYFQDYSPWYNLEQNKEILIDSMPVRLVVGALKEYNQHVRDTLQSYGITFKYVETICDHNLGCLLDEEGINNVSFIADNLDISSTSVKTKSTISSPSGTFVLTQLKSGALHISIQGINGITSVTLHDIQGRIITRVCTMERIINLSGTGKLANGIYFVRMVHDGMTYYKSIIITE